MICKLLIPLTNQATLIAIYLLVLFYLFKRPAVVLVLKLFDQLISTFLAFHRFEILVNKVFFDRTLVRFLWFQLLDFVLRVMAQATVFSNFAESVIWDTYCIRAKQVPVKMGIPLLIFNFFSYWVLPKFLLRISMKPKLTTVAVFRLFYNRSVILLGRDSLLLIRIFWY